MKISTKGRYACRAILELALQQKDRPVKLKDIAREQRLSVKYLENLFRDLKKARFVASVVGKGGGYILAREPAEIRVLDIIETMEGEVAPVECVTNTEYCQHMEKCLTRVIWKQVDEAIKGVLGSITIQDLVDQCYRNKEADPQT